MKQESLLDNTSRFAYFSDDRIYRYALFRVWNSGINYCMFIGLNPSTADETEDDPTIRCCIKFARDWGYDGLCMTNLFGFRSTDPEGLLDIEDPVGPDNDHWLHDLAGDAGRLVAAWGVHGALNGRSVAVEAILEREMHCLGKTKDGFPRHPLYVKGDFEPEPYQ